MNKVYSPFYTAEQYSDEWAWQMGACINRVVMFLCLIIGNEPASKCFLQWNLQSLPWKSGHSSGAWSVFYSTESSLPGKKDADSVGLMLSTFSWMLVMVSVQNKGLEHSNPASLLTDGEMLTVTKHLPELSVSSPGFIYPWVDAFQLDPNAARSITRTHSPASSRSCESCYRTPI